MKSKVKKPMRPVQIDAVADGDLSQAIAKISSCMHRLLASGINRRAIVILLQAETKLPLKTIDRVIDGLSDLAIRYGRGRVMR